MQYVLHSLDKISWLCVCSNGVVVVMPTVAMKCVVTVVIVLSQRSMLLEDNSADKMSSLLYCDIKHESSVSSMQSCMVWLDIAQRAL